MPPRVSVRKRWQIVELCSAGELSRRAIARTLKVDRGSVTQVFERYQETGDVAEHPRPGRPRTTTPWQDKELIHIVRQHADEASPQTAARLQQRTGAKLDPSTVRRRLVAEGLRAHPCSSKPALSISQKARRLAFAKRNRSRQWANVLFSDETKVCLGPRKRLVRRYKGEKTYKRTFKHPGAVNVWACLGRRGFGDIHIFRENLTGTLYRGILEAHLQPSASRVVPRRWTFQDDNDPKHRSSTVKEWLTQQNITRLDWPPNSPDANPIENVFRPLKDNVAARQPRDLDQLEKFIREEWAKLRPEYAAALVDSMPHRIEALIASKGDVIDY
jgi:transposase